MRSVLFGLAASLLASGVADAERFTNQVLGLSIEKPDDWSVLSARALADDHHVFEAANPAMRDAIRNDPYVPLFAFIRYSGSYRGMTSTVKVGTAPAATAAGFSGREFLRGMLPSYLNILQDVKVVTAPEIVSLAGTQAGHMALTFTLNANGASFRVASEMWAIRRGDHFIEVGGAYPSDDRSGDRAAVMKVVSSLRLTN